MTPLELKLLIEGLPQADRNDWERTRLHIYSIASMFSKNDIEPSDIIHFPWDSDRGEETPEMTPETLTALKDKSNRIAKQINLQ